MLLYSLIILCSVPRPMMTWSLVPDPSIFFSLISLFLEKWGWICISLDIFITMKEHIPYVGMTRKIIWLILQLRENNQFLRPQYCSSFIPMNVRFLLSKESLAIHTLKRKKEPLNSISFPAEWQKKLVMGCFKSDFKIIKDKTSFSSLIIKFPLSARFVLVINSPKDCLNCWAKLTQIKIV